MPPRDPFTLPKGRQRLTTLGAQLKRLQKRPRIRVTQGGSSRKFAGAIPAATDGLERPPKPGEPQ